MRRAALLLGICACAHGGTSRPTKPLPGHSELRYELIDVPGRETVTMVIRDRSGTELARVEHVERSTPIQRSHHGVHIPISGDDEVQRTATYRVSASGATLDKVTPRIVVHRLAPARGTPGQGREIIVHPLESDPKRWMRYGDTLEGDQKGSVPVLHVASGEWEGWIVHFSDGIGFTRELDTPASLRPQWKKAAVETTELGTIIVAEPLAGGCDVVPVHLTNDAAWDDSSLQARTCEESRARFTQIAKPLVDGRAHVPIDREALARAEQEKQTLTAVKQGSARQHSSFLAEAQLRVDYDAALKAGRWAAACDIAKKMLVENHATFVAVRIRLITDRFDDGGAELMCLRARQPPAAVLARAEESYRLRRWHLDRVNGTGVGARTNDPPPVSTGGGFERPSSGAYQYDAARAKAVNDYLYGNSTTCPFADRSYC